MRLAECSKDRENLVRPGKNSISRDNPLVGFQMQTLRGTLDYKCTLFLPALSFRQSIFFNACYAA